MISDVTEYKSPSPQFQEKISYKHKSYLAANLKLRLKVIIDWILFEILEKVESLKKIKKGKKKKINKKTQYINKNI